MDRRDRNSATVVAGLLFAVVACMGFLSSIQLQNRELLIGSGAFAAMGTWVLTGKKPPTRMG